MKEEEEFACPGEMLGKTTELIAGSGTYVSPLSNTIRSSLFGRHHILLPPPNADHQKPTIEVVRHKAHGSVPQPGSIVIARVTKVMARMASADIMCVGSKSVREKFTGMIRAYYLSTAKNELGVVSAQSAAGATMIPISWIEMQCPQTGQIEQRKVAKVK
ncbi:hypothetical protein AMTRI_Chr13g121110 [Amborella trichopoda]